MRALVVSNSQVFAWLLLLAAEIALLSLLTFRKTYRTFPAFVTYVAFAVTQNIILLAMARYGGRKSYFFTFWALRAISLTVLFSMVAELYSKIFGSIDSLARFPKLVVRLGAAAGASVCIGVALDLLTGNGALLQPFLQLEKGATAAAFTLIGIIVISAWFYGLPWLSKEVSVSLGLAFDFGIRAVLDRVAAFYSGAYYDIFHMYWFVSLFIALAVWMVAFARSEETKCALSPADIEGIEMTLQQLGRNLRLVNRHLPG